VKGWRLSEKKENLTLRAGNDARMVGSDMLGIDFFDLEGRNSGYYEIFFMF